MFKWEMLGRIFNPIDISGKEWLDEFAQAPSTLVYKDFVLNTAIEVVVFL